MDWVSHGAGGDLTEAGIIPGEFSRTHMTFFGPWDGWKISRVQPLSGDASVFVELGSGHDWDGREGRGRMKRLLMWICGVLTVIDHTR